MAILEAIVAAIDAASSITSGIEKVGKALDGQRSVVLVVENMLSHRLERLGDGHDHGGFAVTPSAIIPPKSVAIFGSQDKGFMTGTKGWVKYGVLDQRDEDSVMEINWSNPFVGANKASGTAWANGGKSPLDRSDLFRVLTVCGAGDKTAEMRYSLLRQ